MKGKVPIIVITVCVIGAVFFLIKNMGSSSEDVQRETVSRVAGDVAAVCSDLECGNEWSQKPSAEVLCPDCDAPGIMTYSYKCRRCKKEFVGLDYQKLGSGKYKFRRTGEEEWTRSSPAKIKCSECGLDSKVHYSNRVGDATRKS